MYEQIDLDAIESNRDEAPDYRAKLKSDPLGTPIRVDERVYRVRLVSSLEAEERSRYDEFAKVAEREGLKNVARVFRDILRDEVGHSGELPASRTMFNLRTSIGREKEKISLLLRMHRDAAAEGDTEFATRLKRMIGEEERHVSVLSETVAELERKARAASAARPTTEEERFCEFGTCVVNPRSSRTQRQEHDYMRSINE